MALAIRRWRVSAVLALRDLVEWYRLRLFDSPSKKTAAPGAAASAATKSSGSSTGRVEVSTLSSTWIGSPAARPVTVRIAALTPMRYSPDLTATVDRKT